LVRASGSICWSRGAGGSSSFIEAAEVSKDRKSVSVTEMTVTAPEVEVVREAIGQRLMSVFTAVLAPKVIWE
jgi:hypothetical protein